jgi:putative ABC transport system permease protein
MRGSWMDISVGLRSFRASPLLIAAALLSLALGIGANSVIFSVLNGLVLHPLPFTEPDRVVLLWQNRVQDAQDLDDASPANFLDWREQSKSFEHLAAYVAGSFNLADSGYPEEVAGARVTHGFFESLGAAPALGRLFTPEEAQPSPARVCIISRGLWERRFGSDPSVVGRHIRINDIPHEVIGVMRPGWFFVPRADVWTPLGWAGPDLKRDDHYLSVVGRLRRGVSLAQARADMDAVSRRLAQTFPKENSGYGVLVERAGDVFPAKRDRRLLYILVGLVGFVLLIACANVANLQLARANARTHQMAIRSALGASRWALLRQNLVENLVLALLGGALGLALCWAGLRLLASGEFFSGYWNEVTLDASVLAFTFAVAVASGVIFGIIPSFKASRPDVRQLLQQDGRSASAGRGFRRFGHALVVVEVMLTVALLAVGAQMTRGFLDLRYRNPGFDTAGLVTMRVSLPASKYGKGQFSETQTVTRTLDQIGERLASLPGVRGVSYVTVLPRSASDPRARFTLPEQQGALGGEAPSASWRAVSTNHFPVLGVPLLKGRNFTDHDKFGTDAVIIVSESLAMRVFRGADPVGKQLYLFDTPRQIVGVVPDLLLTRSGETQPCIYLPHLQSPRLGVSYLLRVEGDPSAVLRDIPARVWEVDKDQPVSALMTYEAYEDLQFAGRRMTTTLLVIFCAVAVVMATVGLYGLVSYLTTQRTKEFAIRMTFGASRTNIFASVMKEVMLITAVGAAAGLAAYLALRGALAGLLGDVLREDWNTLWVLLAGLFTVSALAGIVPAARATAIELADALRRP